MLYVVVCYGTLSFKQEHYHQTPKPDPIPFFIRQPVFPTRFHVCGFFHGVDSIFRFYMKLPPTHCNQSCWLRVFDSLFVVAESHVSLRTCRFIGNNMNNEIEKKLIAVGVDLPQGVGDVTFVSKFNPKLLKNITYLKLFHLLVIISLIFITKYHLQTNDSSWDIHYYVLMFFVYVTGIIFFTKWFFWESDVKIAGANGFIVYGFRFSVKHPQKTLVFYNDIEKFRKYEGGDEWWRRYKSKYYQYDFIQNDKVVFSKTIFWNRPGDDDDLDFMDHILKNWKNYAQTAKSTDTIDRNLLFEDKYMPKSQGGTG